MHQIIFLLWFFFVMIFSSKIWPNFSKFCKKAFIEVDLLQILKNNTTHAM